MTMGAAQSPDQPGLDPAAPSSIPKISELVKKQEQGDMWRTKVLNLLTRMVQVQEEVANHQTQVVQQLSLLVTQVSQVQSIVVQFTPVQSSLALVCSG
ncbi:hypothetical protein ATANTOWER_025431 [Ataeniobius toweri]|uniref:Uncharacterized protein n=1 Tax=Ataeniobius toweri TaxID=208326 RepID=A0ABU7BBH9_9TELE|nr:hypothetical protein [Ataeniobius toweri]